MNFDLEIKKMEKQMTVVDRNPWATLWFGIESGTDCFNPPRNKWAVQTKDDDVEGEDYMNYGPEDLVKSLFQRKITIDEFYEK